MTTTNITVPVPHDRVAEFYQFFSAWLEGSEKSNEGVNIANQEVSVSAKWWKSLKPRERQLFGLWIDAAPSLLSATRIVDAMELNGPRDIPGILSWTTRKGEKVGFKAKWRFEYDAISEEPMYGIDNVAYAELLGQAREAAEG